LFTAVTPPHRDKTDNITAPHVDRREQFSVDLSDQFEALLLIAKPDCFGHGMERIIEYPLPECERQMMLRPVDCVLGWIKFKIHVAIYVKHIVITSQSPRQAMTVSAIHSLS
jgi:hypothetical protein